MASKTSTIKRKLSRRYDAKNKYKELPRPCTVAYDSPPFPPPDSTTARKTDVKKTTTDERRRTDAGAGVVPVMVSYPGTPCTEVYKLNNNKCAVQFIELTSNRTHRHGTLRYLLPGRGEVSNEDKRGGKKDNPVKEEKT